jgi:photosystem II stability/assembly factor-like uncharacterized protein
MTDDEFQDEIHDDFGDEIAVALRARSRAATDDAAVLAAVRRRTRGVRARRVLTPVLAAAIALTGVVIALNTRHTSPKIQVAQNPSSTTTTSALLEPPPSGVEDWTWVNAEHGWALVRKPCGTEVCVGLRETTDGGDTWRSVPVPDALDANRFADAAFDPVAACTARPCLSSVRFATPDVGWLFGPALFQTLEGGQTWTRFPAARVSEVEAAGGIAMRVTSDDIGCAAGCGYRIDRMDLGSTRWERLATAPSSLSPTLLLQGPDVYAVNIPNWAGAGQTVLDASRDAGVTWSEIGDPCPSARAGYRTASASAAPNGVLAVLCLSTMRDTAFMQISTDRGKTFGPQRAVPRGQSAFSPIAAASGDTVAIGYSSGQKSGVIVTHDAGRTWRSTLVTSLVSSRTANSGPIVGWQNAHTGRVSFDTDSMWTTRDGGDTWSEDRVTP